jgi:hypothetical protein
MIARAKKSGDKSPHSKIKALLRVAPLTVKALQLVAL